MKAIRCHAWGPPASLVLDEIPDLVPGPREVVIDVRAAGVNFPDLLIIQGKYQFKPPFPFSPGGEVAGLVRAVGSKVTSVAPGDRVMGMAAWGGFAEQVKLDSGSVVPIPADLGFDTAAALTLTYATCIYALEDRARLRPGENVLVLGAAGGVGTASIEIAKAMGARVIAAAAGEEKLSLCRVLGADEVIDYERDDLRERLKALGGSRGIDVVVDPVGGRWAEPAVRSLAWEGRYLVIGFASGEIPHIPLNLVLLKGCQIVGVFWGSFTARDPARFQQHLATLTAWLAERRIRPHISKTYPLADAARALEDVAARRILGKAVLTI